MCHLGKSLMPSTQCLFILADIIGPPDGNISFLIDGVPFFVTGSCQAKSVLITVEETVVNQEGDPYLQTKYIDFCYIEI